MRGFVVGDTAYISGYGKMSEATMNRLDIFCYDILLKIYAKAVKTGEFRVSDVYLRNFPFKVAFMCMRAMRLPYERCDEDDVEDYAYDKGMELTETFLVEAGYCKPGENYVRRGVDIDED